MKYNININQKKAVEWGLTSSEAIVFSWIYELASWADKIEYKNKTYYYGSKNKACEELPIVSNKRDTIYRLFKSLQGKGLVELITLGKSDYLALTNKGKEWYDINKYANKEISYLIKKWYIIKTNFYGMIKFVKYLLSFKTFKIIPKKNFINYNDQLKDKRWKKLANKIRKRDNYTCQLCRSHEHLQVHHKKYIKGRLAWEYDEENLITLCSECHKKVHNLK